MTEQLGDDVKKLQDRIEKLEEKELELPVAEVESLVDPFGKLRVRLKGQRPENRLLLEFNCTKDLIETIHEAKKRGGMVWVKFKVNGKELVDGKLVVRDLLE